MPSFTSEWFSPTIKILAVYWPVPVVLGLVVMTGVIWMLIKIHGLGISAIAPAKRELNPASLPLPVLRGISGEFAGSTVELGDEPVLIGRDPKTCQLVFPAPVEGISKRHCIVRFHAKSQCFLLVDCNSANGTFVVNSGRLPNGGSQLLNAGQRFYLTSPENMFEVSFEAPR